MNVHTADQRKLCNTVSREHCEYDYISFMQEIVLIKLMASVTLGLFLLSILVV